MMACPYSGDIPPKKRPYSQAGTHVPDVVQSEDQVSYGDYLQLNKILDCQKFQSDNVHDEHLFIVIHQVYELWFKQVLFELDSVMNIFKENDVNERHMLLVISRLNRMHKILLVMVDQVDILETMTPFDFFEFRNFLSPASGFQSTQFRLLENKLGLEQKNRVRYNQKEYWNHFTEEDADLVKNAEKEDTMLTLLEKWLERTPGLEEDGFHFWEKYRESVEQYIQQMEDELKLLDDDPEIQASAQKDFIKTKESMLSIFDEVWYNKCLEKGEVKLSQKAMKGAMMICLYRDEPRFHTAFMLLQLLVDVDISLARWRYRHVLMVQRMIGSKVGTGGSSGYFYLRATTSDKYRIFLDIANIATFVVPRKYLPPVPPMSLFPANSPLNCSPIPGTSPTGKVRCTENER